MNHATDHTANHIAQIVAHLHAHRDPATVPAAAIARAKVFVTDSIGVALSGAVVAESALLMRAAQGWGQGSEATVWGGDVKLPAPSAAMMNAFHIHNQEFDCVHEKAVVHPMAVILAALMAFAESRGGVSGQRFLAAVCLAVDVATVIGMSATKPIRFFRPAQAGCMGAAAGLAYLEELDEAGIKNTLGLAYSQLAGTMQAHIEGTPTLALQVAFAARAAVCAVQLATLGFRGPHDVLDGKYGYFALIEDGVAAPAAPFAELGKVWQITRVSHKPYPTGRAAQGGISALIDIMRAERLCADDIAQVTVAAPPLIRQLVDRPYVANMKVNYARLCLPYLLALAMRDQRIGLDAYSTANLQDAVLAQLTARVQITADANGDVNALVPQHLTVRTNDGRTFERAMDSVYGAPEAPMSEAAQREKFDACCDAAHSVTLGINRLSASDIERLHAALHDFHTARDVRDLIILTIPESSSAT